MAMVIKDDVLEIFIPNSEAVVRAQHKGIRDRSVGAYYMSEKLDDCRNFFNNFTGKYYLDLTATLFNCENIINKLKDLKWENCFKDSLESQKDALSTLKWAILNNKSHFYEIPTPFINEQGKYLKFDNSNPMIDLVKTLALGDIVKLTIRKFGNVFIIYLEDAEKIDEINNSRIFIEWLNS